MSEKIIKINDKPRFLEGQVTIELIGKNGKVIKKENAITRLGKLYMLANSCSDILCGPSGISRGNLVALSKRRKFDNSYGANGRVYNKHDLQTGLYVLNTPDTVDANTRLIPAYNAALALDASEIIGYASYRRTAQTVKEGVIDSINPADLLLDTTISQRWKFDFTQCNGTFNKLAIGSMLTESRFNGVAILKGIESTDPYGYSGTRGYFCAPDMGITGANEILLGGHTSSDEDIARYTLDLSTGIETALEVSDLRYGIYLGVVGKPQYFDGTYCYLISSDSFLRRYHKGTVATDVYPYVYASGYILFERNGFLYMSSGTSNFIAIDMTTFLPSSANDIATSSIIMPSDFGDGVAFDYTKHSIAKKGSLYYVGFFVPSGQVCTLVCTNLLDINNTIVDIIPMVGYGHPCTINGATEILTGLPDTNSQYSSDLGRPAINSSNTTDAVITVPDSLYRVVTSGNLFSIASLLSPITKTSASKMWITYKYTIV